jgi:uncharacterized protein
MDQKSPLGPAQDRFDLVDALRGFALFGILLANILYWSGWLFMDEPQKLVLASPQAIRWEHFLHNLLIDGKFYTIFSLLFGLGFALQLERLASRGANGVRIYLRRVSILLVIGLLHVTLIWDGDILTLYALLGFVLVLMRGWSSRALTVGAVVLLLLPLAGVPLFDRLGWAPHDYFYQMAERLAVALHGSNEDGVAWLKRGDSWSYISWVLSGWPYAIATRLEGWRIPKVLGIMMLGMVLGRRLTAGTLLEDRRLFWLILVLGLLVGVPFSYAYARGPGLGQDSVAAIVGTAPLAFAYAAAFVLAWPYARRVFGILAAPGRMALTNYLSHSLLGIVIFYGVGFGLVGELGPVAIAAVAVAIFAAQTLISNMWLKRFDQGPMEALWRQLTYGGLRGPSSVGTV